MSKMKKIIIVAVILLALVLLFIGGNTFSKYVTEVNGKGVANVAKWSFKVNNNEAQIQTINLASSVDNTTLVDNKIAPGTSGNFEIKIDATGAEVGINIHWEWPYETGKDAQIVANDKIDTQDGKNIAEYTFDVMVEGVQVVPQAS